MDNKKCHHKQRARNTKCGHVSKSNRNGLVFRCEVCSFADNADRIGATNVALRSLLQRQADEPCVNWLIVAIKYQLQAPPLVGGVIDRDFFKKSTANSASFMENVSAGRNRIDFSPDFRANM